MGSRPIPPQHFPATQGELREFLEKRVAWRCMWLWLWVLMINGAMKVVRWLIA